MALQRRPGALYETIMRLESQLSLSSGAKAGPECALPRITRLASCSAFPAWRAVHVIFPLFVALLSVAAPKISSAQCNGTDYITYDGSEGGILGAQCLIFNIKAGTCDTTPIDTVILQIQDGPNMYAPAASLCGTTFDTMYDDGQGDMYYDSNTHFKTGNWSSYRRWDSLVFYSKDKWFGGIPPGDSGWITTCVCCGWGNIWVPFRIIVKHRDGKATTISSNVTGKFYSPPCYDSTYKCQGPCDGLATSISTDPVTLEKHICLTITRESAGALGAFTIDWKWPAGCPTDLLRLINAPPGWTEIDNGAGEVSFVVDDLADGIQNCQSATFCFALAGCTGAVNLCDMLTVDLKTNYDSLSSCNISSTVYGLAGPDNSCCATGGSGPQFLVDPPTQDPETGVWSFCFAIHRSDAMPDTSICIDLNHDGLGRCLEPTSVPWGWHLVSQAGSIYCYKLDSGAVNTGCRTYEWCFQTCDCQNTPFINQFYIDMNGSSGKGDTTGTLPINFPAGIPGTCCGNPPTWHNRDYVTVHGVSPTCVVLTFHNTHYPCCPDQGFSFTLPEGCHLAGATAPGWCWDTLGSTVNFYPCGAQPLACCDSLSDTICTADCLLGFSNWTTYWSYTDECGVHDTDTVSYCGGCGQKTSTPQAGQKYMGEGSQNYPNPFGSGTNFTTTIPFSTTATGEATIRIVDEKGNLVMKEDQEVAYVGKHFFYFTGKELPAGTYYYQIEFPKGVVIVSRSMLLVK